MEWEDEDWSRVDRNEGEYILLLEYKINTIPNSKMLSYDLKVDIRVSNTVRYWKYRDNTTLSCVVYNLISCIDKGCKLVYSRDNTSTKSGKGITVYKVKKAIDWLDKEGYIVNHIGAGSKNVEERIPSWVEPTNKFISLWEEKQVIKARLDYIEQSEVVVVRDKSKNPISYRKTKVVNDMMETVRKINRVNESAVILDGAGQRMTNIYCRIFNESFEQGGRFYRAGILAIVNKNDDARLDVTINGCDVVEVDFSNLHFRIAAALEGMDIDEFPIDVYSGILEDESNKVERKIVKLAVNIMFNCKDRKDARLAIQNEINNLTEDEQKQYGMGSASYVIDLIIARYPEFSTMFFVEDSFGRTLQNHDANLASDILEVFADRNIPCLPIHDSFVLQKEYMDLLCNTMGDCFRNRFGVDWAVPVGVKFKENGKLVEYKISV